MKKRILAFILLLCAAISVLASCAEDAEYESIEYRENGIYFILPNTMRRKASENYEFYFTSEIMGVTFGAKKLTDDFLQSEGIDSGITAGDYVEMIIDRQSFDKDKIYYRYFEDSKQYNFRYTYAPEDDVEYFFYVTVTGDPGNLWCIEMWCDDEKSAEYLPMLERWRKTVGTY